MMPDSAGARNETEFGRKNPRPFHARSDRTLVLAAPLGMPEPIAGTLGGAAPNELQVTR